MGVGKPDDIVGAVLRGIDMFDCVLPTRSGRTGQAFTRRGPINIRNARHAEDPRPLDPDCGCPACRSYSRAYLHHLVRPGEIIARDADDRAQSLLLPAADGGAARRDRAGGSPGSSRASRPSAPRATSNRSDPRRVPAPKRFEGRLFRRRRAEPVPLAPPGVRGYAGTG